MTTAGDWLLLRELLERGDPVFVDRLRAVTDADALGEFAGRWYDDPSPNARLLLLDYLERPLNAFRHEALVKRLFKRAEAAGDDDVMARFLVALDRSIRRVRRFGRHWETQHVDSREQAEALASLWRSRGFQWVQYRQGWLRGRPFLVQGWTAEPYVLTPGGTTMPRGRIVDHVVGFEIARGRLNIEAVRKHLERFRLFSIPTRQYLRRRAWRYFRKLGSDDPGRFVAAISEALKLYEDADVDSGLALIDNWGLIHALFHHSPVLESRPRGWVVAEDRSLSELQPAPIYADAWQASPRAIVDLMAGARCRPVRQWAVRMLRAHPTARASVGLDDILGLLGHADEEVVALAVEWLRGVDDLTSVSPDRWLAVAETASPGALEVVAEIMARQIAPDRISIETAARLAAARPLPIARLGLGWLKSKTLVSDDDRRGLLALLEAECLPLRPGILAWLRSVLAHESRTDWLLEFLDSRHADARAEGLAWFRSEAQMCDDVDLWRRLMESPYDDIRLALTADLEARLRPTRTNATDLSLALDPGRLRLLWASVLLNVNRGSRAKPGAIEQVAHRLARRPEEAESLLPMLAIGLRSLRAPERRASLAAVVRLVEARPDSAPIIQAALPELQWA